MRRIRLTAAGLGVVAALIAACTAASGQSSDPGPKMAVMGENCPAYRVGGAATDAQLDAYYKEIKSKRAGYPQALAEFNTLVSAIGRNAACDETFKQLRQMGMGANQVRRVGELTDDQQVALGSYSELIAANKRCRFLKVDMVEADKRLRGLGLDPDAPAILRRASALATGLNWKIPDNNAFCVEVLRKYNASVAWGWFKGTVASRESDSAPAVPAQKQPGNGASAYPFIGNWRQSGGSCDQADVFSATSLQTMNESGDERETCTFSNLKQFGKDRYHVDVKCPDLPAGGVSIAMKNPTQFTWTRDNVGGSTMVYERCR